MSLRPLEKHSKLIVFRLRDVSAEADKDHKAKVADLEKELSSQGDAFGEPTRMMVL